MSSETMSVRALFSGEAETVLGDATPLMASEAWLNAFPGKLTAYGVFEGTELQAALVLQETKRCLLRVSSDADLSPHCGLTFRVYPGNTEKRNCWQKRVMAALAGFLDQHWWWLTSITFPDGVTDFQPFVWRGFKVVVRYTYQIRLNGQTDEALFAEMSSSRRNEIRNAHKKGLIVTLCRDGAEIERLVAKTLVRQGISEGIENTHALLSRVALPSNSFAYVTYKDGVPLAACFCIHYARRAYQILAGVDEQQGVHAASPMAIFACIQHARDLGIEVYDFEGSMVPGIEQYFRSFGGSLTPIYRVVKASLPIEMALKPFKRALF